MVLGMLRGSSVGGRCYFYVVGYGFEQSFNRDNRDATELSPGL